MNVHYRKGSLLDYDGVYLAEGPWPGKAYFDALRQARKRDAGLYMDYGYTRPNVVSQGPVQQGCNDGLRDGRAARGHGTCRTEHRRTQRDAGETFKRPDRVAAGHRATMPTGRSARLAEDNVAAVVSTSDTTCRCL